MIRIPLVILSTVMLVGLVSSGWAAEITNTSGWAEPIPVPCTQSPGWDTLADSPIPTGRSAIGWIDDYVYLFGNEGNPSLALYFHVPTETWGYSTPCPDPGYNWTGAVAGGELYLLGRYDGANPTRDFWRFTPDGAGGGTWTRRANYPLAITMLATGADEANGLIYAAGGFGGAVCRDAHVYDIAQNTWSPIPPMDAARAAAGGAFLKGKFYVVAGLDSVYTNYTNTLYAYDPDSSAWLVKKEFPFSLGFNWSSVTADTNYLFQVGGGGGYHIWPASRYVYYYDPETDGWAALEQLPTAYGTNSAVWVGDSLPFLFSTGGWNGAVWVDLTFKLTEVPVGVEEATDSRFPVPNGPFLECFPNPFTRATTIRYSLPPRGGDPETRGGGGLSTYQPINLSVYDLAGRLVSTVLDEPSSHSAIRPYDEVVWDGRDRSGRSVPSGAYFYRLTAGSYERTKILVILR